MVTLTDATIEVTDDRLAARNAVVLAAAQAQKAADYVLGHPTSHG